MSNALTLARPYARAAFALANEHGLLPQWSTLFATASVIAADSRVAAVLGDPKVGAQTLADLVAPEQADEQFRRFLALLADNRRLALLPEIAGLYETLRAEQEQVVKATVTSAVVLDAGQIEQIKRSLSKRFGREVAIETALDPALIGGAVIDAGDIVIDGSVRTKLARLGAALAQ